jgi:uncharacterized protein YlxP (DUF503 family)
MYVGVAILELLIEDAQSLKDKRMVVRSLRDKVRRTFEISVAEVGLNDLHQRARLGLSLVSNSRKNVEAMLNKIGEFVENHAEARVLAWSQDVLPFESGDAAEGEEEELKEEDFEP